jgi:putative transposase
LSGGAAPASAPPATAILYNPDVPGTSPPHRKRVKHRESWRESRMLTFSCYRRLPLLADDPCREIVACALRSALARHGWLLTAFVFMPDHVHLLTLPWSEEASGADRLLFSIKRPSSFRIKQYLEAQRNRELLDRLTVQERPGKTAFRFWQEGPGHDHNVRDPDKLGEAIGYIHNNPVRRGLCNAATDWEWSSARQYRDLPIHERVPRVTRWSWGGGLELES